MTATVAISTQWSSFKVNRVQNRLRCFVRDGLFPTVQPLSPQTQQYKTTAILSIFP